MSGNRTWRSDIHAILVGLNCLRRNGYLRMSQTSSYQAGRIMP